MKKVFQSLGVLLILAVIAWVLGSDPIQMQGEEVVERVELFRNEHHRIPISLEEIGVYMSESGPIYYQRTNEQNYKVWYGMAFTLGESVTYDSQTHTWDR